MLSMIADWQQSGKSKKAYCAENGINEATFYYWFSRSKENDTSRGSFITIYKAARRNDIEVIYPNGVRIKIENDLALLSQLIRLY
ncbi:IS66 family insertion sequence element accessory protein TnpB [Sphingobacterium alkalisoli]|uniref:IS66 family insertion sequence element accessory protein TnpB n=2 Tax=Sphingobacterium alkalisoli TaxID=1874115 RepID=A0A4U0H673_9SPHI|nr:IS66 family insertion sequence element accessory protein TnpB [Sphingobacterium alkalisoli]